MWEIFTLGRSPYPGVDNAADLLQKLRDDHRLEKPKYANDRIYELMIQCWNSDPDKRISFDEISSILGDFLHVTVKNVSSNFIHELMNSLKQFYAIF